MSEIPKDLALWIGLVIFGGLGKWLVDRVFAAPERAQAALQAAQATAVTEWRSDVKTKLEQILAAQAKFETGASLQGMAITNLQASHAELEKRQDKQATNHLSAMTQLRQEFTAYVDNKVRGA